MSAVLRPSEIYGVVPKADIDAVWPHVEKGIADALATSNGEATPEDTKEGLKSGRTHLLIMERDGAMLGVVFMFLWFPRYKIARILLAFGAFMRHINDLILAAEKAAKDLGCKYIEAWVATASRERLFSRFGYRPTYTIIRKPL